MHKGFCRGFFASWIFSFAACDALKIAAPAKNRYKSIKYSAAVQVYNKNKTLQYLFQQVIDSILLLKMGSQFLQSHPQGR